MSEKTEKESERLRGMTKEIKDDLEKKLAEIRRSMDEIRHLTGEPSKLESLKSLQDVYSKKITINAKNIATKKIEQKLDDICKDMEQTDKKVAKLKKKLITEI